MEQQAPCPCRPRAVLSTALGSRALLCLLCALAAACWPAAAGAAPAPDPAPQAPAPAPDPAPGAGTTQPTQTPSSGTVTSSPAPPVDAPHRARSATTTGAATAASAARPAPTRQVARRPERAKAHRAAVRRAKARHAAARREAVRRANARRAAAQRARGAPGTDPSAIARLTDLVPNTSTNDLSSTAYSWPRADSSHSSAQAAHSSQSRHASHEVSCVEAPVARDCSGWYSACYSAAPRRPSATAAHPAVPTDCARLVPRPGRGDVDLEHRRPRSRTGGDCMTGQEDLHRGHPANVTLSVRTSGTRRPRQEAATA